MSSIETARRMRHRLASAIALMALVLAITVIAAPNPAHQNAAAEAHSADYLVLNPELD